MPSWRKSRAGSWKGMENFSRQSGRHRQRLISRLQRPLRYHQLVVLPHRVLEQFLICPAGHRSIEMDRRLRRPDDVERACRLARQRHQCQRIFRRHWPGRTVVQRVGSHGALKAGCGVHLLERGPDPLRPARRLLHNMQAHQSHRNGGTLTAQRIFDNGAPRIESLAPRRWKIPPCPATPL